MFSKNPLFEISFFRFSSSKTSINNTLTPSSILVKSCSFFSFHRQETIPRISAQALSQLMLNLQCVPFSMTYPFASQNLPNKGTLLLTTRWLPQATAEPLLLCSAYEVLAFGSSILQFLSVFALLRIGIFLQISFLENSSSLNCERHFAVCIIAPYLKKKKRGLCG